MKQGDPQCHATHHVYVVEGKGDDAFWTKIEPHGNHADGNGLNLT